MNTIKRSIWLSVVVLALSACGGGGKGGAGGGAGGANTPPASASASTQGFISYLQQIIAANSDTAAPVEVGAFNAPTSDSDDPAAL